MADSLIGFRRGIKTEESQVTISHPSYYFKNMCLLIFNSILVAGVSWFLVNVSL